MLIHLLYQRARSKWRAAASPYFRSQSRRSFIIYEKCVRGLSLSAISDGQEGGDPFLPPHLDTWESCARLKISPPEIGTYPKELSGAKLLLKEGPCRKWADKVRTRVSHRTLGTSSALHNASQSSRSFLVGSL